MLTENLTLIIPWSNRDSLGTALSANLAALEESRCRVILVNCGGNIEALMAQVPVSLKRSSVIDVRHPFNKALSINLGLAVASTTLVSVMDADIIFSLEYLQEVAHALMKTNCYTTAARVIETDTPPRVNAAKCIRELTRQNYLHFHFRDGKKIKFCTLNSELLTGAQGGPGLLAAHCTDLKTVGGFNSELSHWGWEDQDIQLRLIYRLGLERLEVGTVSHLTHSDDTRNLASLTKQQANIDNMNKCLEEYDRGNFEGSYARDIKVLHEIRTL